MAGRTFKVAGRDILVDVGHANQWLVQFLYILGVQFDGELVTGEYGLSGGGDVFAVAVDIHDYAMVGKFERIDLLAVEIGSGHHFHVQSQPLLLTEGRFVDHLFIEHYVEWLYSQQFREIIGESSYDDGRIENFEMPCDLRNQDNGCDRSAHDGDQEGAHSDQHDIAHTFHPDDPVLHQDEGIELTGQSACHQSRDKAPSRQSGGEGKNGKYHVQEHHPCNPIDIAVAAFRLLHQELLACRRSDQ